MAHSKMALNENAGGLRVGRDEPADVEVRAGSNSNGILPTVRTPACERVEWERPVALRQ